MPNLMETANCLVALGNDKGNLVPKYGITLSEIMVLRFIHGDEAVIDIEPVGAVDVGDREELDRLLYVFNRPAHQISPVRTLYPGANPRLDRVFAKTSIPEGLYKATQRATPASTIAGTLADKDAEIEALKAQLAAATAKKPRKAAASVDQPELPPEDGSSLLD